MVWLGFFFFFFWSIYLTAGKGAFCSVGWDPRRAVAAKAAATVVASAGDPTAPAACRSSGRSQGEPPPPSLPGWLQGVNVPPPPVCQSVPLHVCLSDRLWLSLAAQRGILAFLRSALRAATLAGCQSVHKSICPSLRVSVRLAMQGPSSRLLSPHLSPSPTSVPVASLGQRRASGREGARECYALSLFLTHSLSLSFSLSLSLRSSLPVSSCLTAPTCPLLCHSVSPTLSQPASVRPSVPRPLPPRLRRLPLRRSLPSHAAGTVAGGGARLLPAAPAASGPRPGWKQRVCCMWPRSCSGCRLQSLPHPGDGCGWVPAGTQASRPQGAGRGGPVGARAPARCARRARSHPFPWPFSAGPKARDKAHEPRAAA